MSARSRGDNSKSAGSAGLSACASAGRLWGAIVTRVPSGIWRKPGIGRDPRDPSICPSRDGGAEADLRGDVEKQVLERAPCRDGFAVRPPLGGDVRCQHAAKRRLVADKRVDTEPRDRADEFTQELDVVAEPRVRRIRRADEEMGEPGALDDEELRVQMREEGRARLLLDVIPGEARRRIQLVDVEAIERAVGECIELLAARDQHGPLAGLGPEKAPNRAAPDER